MFFAGFLLSLQKELQLFLFLGFRRFCSAVGELLWSPFRARFYRQAYRRI